jgi:hypothetical protein
MMITPRQREMLVSFERDGEATDFANFDSAGTLAWRNRERVIDALIRKGMIDDNQKLTDAGRAALGNKN